MEKASFSQPSQVEAAKDKIESTLQLIAEHIVTIVFGFLPIIFLPIAFIPLDYGKVIVVIAALALTILFLSLAVLRSGTITLNFSPTVLALWGVVGIAALSALFSGDSTDSFIGDLFEVHTVVFLLILALIASLTSVMKLSKMSIMRLYIFLTASAGILGLFHVARLAFGAGTLSLGIFTDSLNTTVGSWNDLGLFFGLSVLLSMVALEQLPLTKWGRVVFTVGIVLSLIMLAVINFSVVWWVLGLVSLVMLMYSLIRDRFSEAPLAKTEGSTSSIQSILLSLGIFIVSLTFIIAGSALGGMIADATGISYVEVRPSFSATTDVARAVYGENAFFGVGPNKFIDAWREFKDPAINQTIFWNTDFRGGNGYVTSFLVTTGILGTLAWLIFFGFLLYAGFRMLFKTVHADRFWYFIGSSSFIATVYLWGMSFVYLPGAAILVLAAAFTSVTLAAYIEIVGTPSFSLSVRNNKRAAILLVGVVMVIVIASASTLYYAGRHFTAVYAYADTITSVQPGTPLTQVEQGVANAFAIYPSDVYARQIANYQMTKINTLINRANPTAEEQQEFQNAVVNGINSAQTAVDLDPTDVLNWSALGSIYSVLVAAGEQEVLSRAEEAIANARNGAPNNPFYTLQEAQLQIRAQNTDRGRELINEAIAQKPNYTEALSFLTELDIATGRVNEAIDTTRSIINLEPNNPARWYQLGVLYTSVNNIDEAINSFQRAVSLDPNYANARYLLALAFAQQGRDDEAVEQLGVVRDLNPENQVVTDLIRQIESGEYDPTTVPAASAPVSEPEVVVEEDDTVTSTEVPDSPLISPVNAVPETSDDSDGADTETPTEETEEAPAEETTEDTETGEGQ